MHTIRRIAVLVVSVVVAAGATLLVAGTAHAAPSRSNGRSNTVFFVHGYAPDGSHDCSSYWSSARTHFTNKGWTGAKVTFGYYKADTNCTYEYGGTRDSSLTTVAKALANRIYNSYSRHGRKVDVVAHSMGGLIIRAALYHTVHNTSGFPPYIYVEDVVTLGTPHDGTLSGWACVAYKQCQQMKGGSAFLKGLPEGLSNSAMGTDWTLISSFDDGVVSEGSGVGANSEHKIQYRYDKVSHTDLK